MMMARRDSARLQRPALMLVVLLAASASALAHPGGLPRGSSSSQVSTQPVRLPCSGATQRVKLLACA